MGHFVLGALSLLTLIPTPVTMAIGAAASIANAAWYFHDGQTFEGICSLLCVLPVFGPTMGKIGMVAIGFMNIGKMNYDNWNRYVIGDEIYSWDQAKRDILTGTLSIASVYGGAKGLGWDKVEVPTKLKGSIDLDAPITPPSKQRIANEAAKQYNVRYNPTQRAIDNGYVGVTTTKNGGVSFKGTEYVYRVDGKEAIVRIKATGSRTRDFNAANQKVHLPDTPDGYVWHHVDNYNVRYNSFTIELITEEAHKASIPHSGACAQYDAVYGPTYNR